MMNITVWTEPHIQVSKNPVKSLISGSLIRDNVHSILIEEDKLYRYI